MKQDMKCKLCGYVVHGDSINPEKRRKRHERNHNEKLMWVTVW